MLNFAPFTTTVCINLTIIDDTLEEKEEEVFMIGMTSLSTGGIADQNAVLVTIIDDECELINCDYMILLCICSRSIHLCIWFC